MTSAKPLVSVIVPVFNAERYLRQSLSSILSQTYEPLEVIVVDDGSHDRSADVAAELAEHDRRVSLYRHGRNRGQFANVNAGLRLARGELIAVYHADDVYHSEIVAREVEYLQRRPRVGAVFTLVNFIDEHGRDIGGIDRLPSEIESAEILEFPVVLNALLRHTTSFLPTPSALVRRSVYGAVGLYRTDYGLRGDLDMWLRIAREHPLALIAERLVQYRIGDHNESRRYAYLRTEPELFFKVIDDLLASGAGELVHRDSIAAYEARRAADLLRVAANTCVLGDRGQMRRILQQARLSRLLRSKSVKRFRLLLLFLVLHALARLPHSGPIGRVFVDRWHRGQIPRFTAGAAGEATRRPIQSASG